MYRIKLEVRENETTAQFVWWYYAGADPASNFRGGAISTKFGCQSHYGFTTVREIQYRLRNTTVTKQRTAKWLHIMNGVLPNCTKS